MRPDPHERVASPDRIYPGRMFSHRHEKHFPTYIHETCITFPFIYISAGIRGLQIKIAPDDLIKETKAEICSLFTE